MALNKKQRRERIKLKIRKTVNGTATTPRLSVFRSNSGIFAQLLDDLAGKTILAAGSDDKTLIWVGIGLNLLASLINVYEKINNTMLKKLMNDIKSIKDGKYLVESQLIDIPESIKNTTEGTPLLTQINNLQEPLLQKNTT